MSVISIPTMKTDRYSEGSLFRKGFIPKVSITELFFRQASKPMGVHYIDRCFFRRVIIPKLLLFSVFIPTV